MRRDTLPAWAWERHPDIVMIPCGHQFIWTPELEVAEECPVCAALARRDAAFLEAFGRLRAAPR